MIPMLCLLFFVGCKTKVPEPVQVTSIPLREEGRTWRTHARRWTWDKSLEAAVEKYAPHLKTIDPVCPSKSGEHIPLYDLLRAVVFAESSYNPLTVYRETSGHDSIGLFQLSYSDQANYKFPMIDLKDPEENIVAGVRILGHLTKSIGKDPCAFYLAGGRYWATLRTPACWKVDARPKAWGNMVAELERCL
jgi:hypothetical protein